MKEPKAFEDPEAPVDLGEEYLLALRCFRESHVRIHPWSDNPQGLHGSAPISFFPASPPSFAFQGFDGLLEM